MSAESVHEEPRGDGIAAGEAAAPSLYPVAPPRNVPHWTGWLLLALGVFTLPWTANLAVYLPDKSEAAHYNASWVGFDLLLCALLIRTGWSLLRRRAYVEVTAAMTAVMLFIDAWFDVLSAPTAKEFAIALVLASCAEVPLAVFCLWVSRPRRIRAPPPRGADEHRGATAGHPQPPDVEAEKTTASLNAAFPEHRRSVTASACPQVGRAPQHTRRPGRT